MKNIQSYQQFNESVILTIAGGILLFVFFKKLIKNIKDKKYIAVINRVLADNSKETVVKSGEWHINISTKNYTIIIDKRTKTANFFKKTVGDMIPMKAGNKGLVAICDYPLHLTDEQYEFLVDNLKKKEFYAPAVREEADYRNVTGYGSMGTPSDQRAGPSFNKGPMSATYRQPTVIGTESGYIEDPYFAGREENVQKKKKNKDLVKMRKNKYRVLRKQDVDSRKKMIS